MKQLLFLLLLPAFAMAQYPGNANQKITLGEQTTADGLVWRGRLADTANLLTNKLDTSVYIVLDTGTRAMWYYRASTTPKWTRLVDSLNNLQGTLSVAKGGTGSATQNFVDLTTTQSIGGAKTFTSELTATRFNPTANTATETGMFLPAANTLGFSTNGTEKVRITSAGNLGLGVTPSAWASWKALQIAGNAILAGYSNNTILGNNWYYDGTDRYTSTGFSTIYQQYSGNHSWFTAPSGTAGNPITFTQAMTLDNSGRLGIGTTSPSAPLTVSGNISLGNRASSGTSYIGKLREDNGGISNSYGIGFVNSDINGAGYINFYTTQVGGSGDTRMTITGSGNVGIGTTSPQSGYRLHVVDSVYVGGNVSASAYTTLSDYDLKDEIQNISYGINEVMQMQPVKYTYKSNGSTQLGFIAQDLGVITPEVVSFEDKMSVYYNALIPILTKAIQEQQALIKALEQRIINLENK